MPRHSTPVRRTATESQISDLIEEYGLPLRRYAVWLTGGDRWRAEELVQETVIRAWRHPDVITNRRHSSLVPWLFTVARRLSIDAERARRARPRETSDAGLEEMPEACDSTFDKILTSAVVRQALLTLSPEQRAVLVCIYYQGMTGKETSRALGVPLGTVKSRGHHALKSMQRRLHAQRCTL
ncbi:sigma-70 family RNA polymerase sigma factor [Streptomyces sp. KR80]|uniref:sigma-70 family RNA polymerase sigma factor n=1 Tax=Streptomyces sp. KR80 TaxID=3457426 RepID=UPI003FD67A4A